MLVLSWAFGAFTALLFVGLLRLWWENNHDEAQHKKTRRH
jgi:hypothetical protein